MINSDRVYINPEIPERTLLSFRQKIRFDFITGCWEWTGSKGGGGYGQVGNIVVRRKNTKAHQLSWIIYNGNIPDGLWVCHKCDNTSCVNPDHLFLGSPKENAQDKYNKGRANHPVGEATGHTKLNEETVGKIISLIEQGRSSREIKKELGLDIRARTIRQIMNGETWRQVPRNIKVPRRINQHE